MYICICLYIGTHCFTSAIHLYIHIYILVINKRIHVNVHIHIHRIPCPTEDLDIPELRAHSVLAWAGNRMGNILDDAAMFLTDSEAFAFAAMLVSKAVRYTSATL